MMKPVIDSSTLEVDHKGAWDSFGKSAVTLQRSTNWTFAIVVATTSKQCLQQYGPGWRNFSTFGVSASIYL